MRSNKNSVLPIILALLPMRLAAGDVDSRILRLIGPGVNAVYGMDLDRYRSSPLSQLIPVDVDLGDGVRQVIVASKDIEHSEGQLKILIGASAVPAQPKTQDSPEENSSLFIHKVLSGGIAIRGEAAAVEAAYARWTQPKIVLADIAASVRRLSGAYDQWFVLVKPIAALYGVTPATSKYHLAELIEEVRGGVRLGKSNEFVLELVAATAEDAAGFAAIGRWLPGLLELKNRGWESEFLAAVEDFSVSTAGRVVTLSASIPETALTKMIDDRKARVQ